MSATLRIVDQPAPDHDTDVETEESEPPTAEIDSADLEVQSHSTYAEATEPEWDRYSRRTGAFLCELLPAVEKAEFVNDSVHHFKQLEELRVVDELDTAETDDVDLAVLFALPDESVVFVGQDPTTKDGSPLFGFVVEPFAPIPEPTTAQEALDLLRPGDVRDAFAEGDEPDRQGEWWLLPTKQVPLSATYRPGVQSRPYGPSPLDNHVPREWGMTATPEEFMTRVREAVPQLPESVETPPEVVEWMDRQHRKRVTPEFVPDFEDLVAFADEVLIRGTLRHRENDHYTESVGEQWHRAVTHEMEVFTADEFGRVFLD